MNSPRAAAGENGFTLVETLVAMMVLAIALTMVLQLFSGGINSKRRSEEYTRAIFHASEVMEGLLVSGTTDQTLSGSFDDGYVWEAVLSPFQDDSLEADPVLDEKGPFLYEVALTLSWESGHRIKRFQVTTLKMIKEEG